MKVIETVSELIVCQMHCIAALDRI